VEDAINESDAWRLVGVLVWKFDVDLPDAAFERSLCGPLESHVELLHIVVYQSDFIVTHQHLHNISFDSSAWATHLVGCARGVREMVRCRGLSVRYAMDGLLCVCKVAVCQDLDVEYRSSAGLERKL